jgi:serine phosphatase RsbU (regulator of sigma subunit)
MLKVKTIYYTNLIEFILKQIYLLGILLCITLQVAHSQVVQDLLLKYNESNDASEKSTLALQIALMYQKQKVHQKAIEYLKLSQNPLPAPAKQKQILERLSFSYQQLKDYPQAINTNLQLLDLQKQNPGLFSPDMALRRLTDLYIITNQPYKALDMAEQTFQYYRKAGQMVGIVESYNNLGFISKSIGENKKALDYFKKSVDISKSLGNFLDPITASTILINTGTAYAEMGDFRNAQTNFEKALDIRMKEKDGAKIAEAYNYIGANYYLEGNLSESLDALQQAVTFAQSVKADEVLQTTYKLLAEVYRQRNNLTEFEKYNTLNNQIKENLAKKEAQEQDKIIQTQLDIEKKENDLKLLLADKQKQDLELNQARLERERQAQDIALKGKELEILRQNQEKQRIALLNQQLEKDKTNQLLQLTRQKAEADRQKQAFELQETNLKLQALALEKQEADKKKRESEIATLEKDKKYQEQLIRDEQRLKFYIYLVLGLVIAGLIYTIYNYLRDRKRSQLLKKQNEAIQEQASEIQSQNEELHQNQEEIMAQRDNIAQKNKELSVRDRQITSSIAAAKTIQQAILPYPEKLKHLLDDYFIIYHPKDVVSGDFYWLNEVDNKIILAAVDCTGHGVPGAFMSLIGNTVLDKIVRVWKILEPADILGRLHEDIRVMLRQTETLNNYGMDVAILIMEKLNNGQTRVHFSGARRPLYYLENEGIEIKELSGDRKSIGGLQNENKQFTNQEIVLDPGSILYVGSDGYVDQNDLKRKRFGEARFKELLLQIKDKPLSEQKLILENTLTAHMLNTQQRDDILLIGFKL